MTRALPLEAATGWSATDEAAAHDARRGEMQAVQEEMAAGWMAWVAAAPAAAAEVLEGCDDAGLSATHPSISRDGRGFVTALSGCRIRMASTAPAGSTPEQHARAWVRSRAKLFGLESEDFDAAGRVRLTTRRVRARRDGATIVRLDQELDGKPVFTAGLRIFVHPDGSVGRVAGHLTPPWTLGSLPALAVSASQAATTAAAHLGEASGEGWASEVGVWDDAVSDVPGAEPRWVHRVRPTDLPAAPYVFVDVLDMVERLRPST